MDRPVAKRVLRPAEVTRVERRGTRLVVVHFGGAGLAGYDTGPPAGHLQLYLPADGEEELPLIEGEGGLVFPPERGRPTVRTYTPRRFDPATGELEVHLVVHGAGPGATWAQTARPGDRVVLGGPTGGYELDPGLGTLVIGGDETALPAVAALVEAAGPTTRVVVWGELPEGEPEPGLDREGPLEVTWLRPGPDDGPCDLLRSTLTDPDRTGAYLAEDPATRFWVAGESAATRAIRRHLVDDHGLDRDVAHSRAYWKVGKAGPS